MKKKRILYAILFFVLLAAEIAIGSFASGFLRGYIGDVLVVLLLWSLARIFFPARFRWLSAGIFAFAVLIEALQGINILELLNIKNPLLHIIFGSTFDLADILCYAAGCLIVGGFDAFEQKITERS